MKIDGIGTKPAIPPQSMKKNNQDTEQFHNDPPAVETTEGTETQEKLRGVIRNLQNGHFKGVADVRLRINFFDEIEALETQNLKSTAETDFGGFSQTVQQQIDALKTSGLLNPDQVTALDTFWENLLKAKEEFMNNPDAALQTFIGNLQNGFDALMNALTPPPPAPPEEILTETSAQPEIPPQEQPENTPAETTAAGQPVEEIPTDPPLISLTVEEPQNPHPSPLEQLVETFRTNVQQAIDDLNSSLSSTSVLPPISEPSGNGKAFTKFMEQYEAMQSGIQIQTPEAEILDFEEVIITEEGDPVTEPA